MEKNMNSYMEMGYTAGTKLRAEKDWIRENASVLTDGKQNIKQVREFIFKVATQAEEPIPVLLTKSDSQLKRNWTDILSYITGAYNGAISKPEKPVQEKPTSNHQGSKYIPNK